MVCTCTASSTAVLSAAASSTATASVTGSKQLQKMRHGTRGRAWTRARCTGPRVRVRVDVAEWLFGGARWPPRRRPAEWVCVDVTAAAHDRPHDDDACQLQCHVAGPRGRPIGVATTRSRSIDAGPAAVSAAILRICALRSEAHAGIEQWARHPFDPRFNEGVLCFGIDRSALQCQNTTLLHGAAHPQRTRCSVQDLASTSHTRAPRDAFAR